MFILPHPLAGSYYAASEFPHAAAMHDTLQDDGFGNLIQVPYDNTCIIASAIMCEGINEWAIYEWHQLYAGH